MIKSTVKIEKESNFNFPCIMISNYDGSIVLFISESEGIYLDSGRDTCSNNIGKYSKYFVISNFQLFKGSITLEQ